MVVQNKRHRSFFVKERNNKRETGLLLTAFLCIFALCCAAVLPVQAESKKTKIRVGFFEFDGYHQQDENGKKSGYGYDFLQMIAPYADFEYEYVGYDKGWSEMQRMLQDGEIDMVTSAQKTPEREKIFDFPAKSMGSSYTMLTTRSDNMVYTTEDYSTLEGIRVGMLEDSSRNISFDNYAKEHGFTYHPVYYKEQDEMLDALSEGKDIDAVVTSDLRTLRNETVIDKFDEAKIYAIVKKGNHALVSRINEAITRLSLDSPDWKSNLVEKYYRNSSNGKKLSLTMAERLYVEQLDVDGKKLRVLLNPDQKPYSYFEDGQPKGIMVDLLAGIAKKAGLPYEIMEVADADEYYEAMESGEPDIIFDAFFDYDTAEKLGYHLTSSYYSMTYARVIHNNDSTKRTVVAVNDSDNTFRERYPILYKNKEILHCDSMNACMEAVRDRKADYTYVFSHTALKTAGEDYTNAYACEILNNISCPVAVAVNAACDSQLYSLMNKAAETVGEEERQRAINANTKFDVEGKGLMYLIYNEPVMVILFVLLITGVIVALVLWFRSREKEAERRHREIDARQKEALKEAYEAADRANRAKSSFLSGMSHDIRTPLNAIIGMVAIARAHVEEPGRVSDCLAKITSSSRHLLGLINEVLDMSKIESGKVTLTEEEFNLADLLDNLVELVHPGIKARNHELIIRAHDMKHEDVIGDSLRIQQVFVNIAGNASKYTPNGGRIEIDVTELPSKAPKIGVYKFVFKDNGIGMSEDFVRTIFDPFSREKDSRVNKIQGTGLGMAITKNIVSMMDGTIEVESEQGKGSVFTVIIRLKLQAKEVEQENVEALAGLPVLVVDDDADICESTCLMLDEIGMDSAFALSGMEAVDKVMEAHAAEDDFYAVIVDWKMPDMDGLATTRAIREAVGEEVPIIIFTAYDWSDIEEEARAAGANAFVSKPLFKSKLIHTFDMIVHDNDKEEESNALELFEQMDFSGKHLLLVEDNELNCEIVREILSMTQIDIDVADNGEVAVKKFMETDCGYYDLILMDVQMPVMNGYDATMTIRSMERDDAETVPIIAMTANAFAEDVEKAMAAHMNEHLAKPLDILKLAELLNRWLNQEEE